MNENIKKDKVGSQDFLKFKSYYKTIIISTVWYWHSTDKQINGKMRRSPEVYLQFYGYLLFKDSQAYHFVFSINYIGMTKY